ncbi:hypothetical protein Q8A67_018070 [Cirrhinus molitorella]|uniref:VWFD domain-containing protein n=1 Tax=Cirrhinus molitorella TaxID=172907 RepID=A0AA88P8G0_9TELE|nr:hypothetical protein Q8A67_018070 [Cirrhinus molitorella]
MGAKLLPVCFLIFLFWDGGQARSAGQEFATAFMQNYVSPFDLPLFQLYITSLNSNCLVRVSVPSLSFTQEVQLTAGQNFTVTLPKTIELSGTRRSRKTVFIQASNDITVSSLNSKQFTADTSLVYPMSEWGTEYFVFTPTNSPPSMLKEFVLVNGKEQNTVEVFLRAAVRFEGRLYGIGSKLVVIMDPFENVQIQSQGDLTGTRISSQLPVAVYSGHMCTWRLSKCNHVYEQLLPVQSWGTRFLVAPFSIQSQFDSVYIQASQSTNITVQFGQTTLTAFLQRGLIREYKIQFPNGLNIIADRGIQVFFLFNGVRTSRGVIYDPFLMNLLSNDQFCSSYAIDGIAGFSNRALLIVPTSELAGIHFDRLPLLGNLQWRVIKNSEYSWTELVYQPGANGHKLTHPNATYGVYSVGVQQVNGYGAPAACIDADFPTPRSCFNIICSEDEECQMMGFFPTCVKKPFGICWAMGDPHYSTFDRRYFDFMGTCTYVVTRTCQQNGSLPAFEVLAKNENRGDISVSYVAHVTVNIGDITISAESSEPGKVRIDQILWSLPVVLDGVGVSIFQSGSFITILFNFGLSVQYDWNHYLVVSLPIAFMNKVCGLCGNFNGDPNDDFTTPSNTQAPSATTFGQSWRVHNLTLDEGCRDDGGGHGCDAQAQRQWLSGKYCELLMMAPFSQCHSVIDPSIYIQNCMYDVCMTDGHRYYLCKILEVYATACQRVEIQLTNWREAANCSYRCPENSHYESCGSACPLTCMGLRSPVNCTLPCVETCACDPGFVLSGSKCVPTAQCGCSYKGHYIPAGEDFWEDDACQRLCRCSTEGGLLECRDGGCGTGEHCQVENGVRGCYPVSQRTCVAQTDPHYYTFDGNHFNFQGNCVYQLVGVCVSDPGLVPFDVLVQNEFRGSRVVTFTKLLEIRVYNISIVINREYSGFVTVNGELSNLPLHLIEGQVSVFRSGWYAVVQTSFGLRVTFDWISFATVTVPSTYMGAVCGLCGNYNGNPEDDLTVKGTTLPASGPTEFGASWSVATIPDCIHGCTNSCQNCDPARRSLYETSDFCGLLRDPQGPFRDCHAVLNPAPFFEDCVYDVCLYNGRRDILCQAITAYVSACQAMGRTIGPWRTTEFCGVQCPVHSHYELCGSSCEVTCHSLAPPAGCRSGCMEGCVCDPGYIRSGEHCVPLSQCGCLYKNHYYLLYQQFYPGNNCEEVCTCLPYGQVVCNRSSCGPYEKCELVEGVRRCQPIGKAICEASGDPHYVSFDGRRFDFQGTCTYILSQSCGLERTNLTHFSIQVENERWWPNKYHKVSVTKQVALTVYGSTIILRQNEPQILVNGVLTNLPYSSNSLNGFLVQAYKEGSNYIIKTGFGLRVTYDLSYYVTVTIPGNYRNKTCGLCGNFDGVPSNDFSLPDGNVTKDVNVFGRAWKVDIPGAVCEDGCEGSTCLDCDPRLKAIFEKPPYCGVLVDSNGPFAACHAVLNPTVYLNDCVFDTCASDGNNSVVCDSVARYASSCCAAGVIIQRWRNDSFCPMSCPAHSHYELCADVCSAACPGLTTIVQCPRTCTEGCACDNGYLFDGQQCVEHQQCGCYQQGLTYKAGEVVYLDQCVQKCQCDSGKGLTCEKANCLNGTECLLISGMWGCFNPDPCRYHRCPEGETCRSEHGNAVCVPLYNSTCWAWGDPHYHTFDGYEYNFQGTCRYVLSKTCGNLNGLEPFSVTQSNENRGSTDVSYVREVEVTVYGSTYTMVNHHTGQIMVDGLWFYLPLDHQNGRVRVRQSGNAALLETNFGLRVSYMWGWRVDVHLPSSYYGVVCGLCGNLNSNIGDELKDPAGNPLPSVYQWAKSWRVEDNYHVASACNDGCETDCPVCPPDLRVLYETEAFCGVLTSTGQNVFSACHTKVNPQAFKQSCAYDLCFNNGDHRLLCQALETYVARCRQEGVIITDWRGRLNCSMSCPPDSHYEACASPCPAVCPFPNQQPNCTDTCVEACVCNSGFVLSAGACVPTNQCGCFYKGAFYQQGQTFWADDQCHQLCTCDRNLSTVVCRNSSCPVGESCLVVNGSRSCQPVVCDRSSCGPYERCELVGGVRRCLPISRAICEASGDPHYVSFDGRRFDFQGTCTYILSQSCGLERTNLTHFSIQVENERWWPNKYHKVSVTKQVALTVYGSTIILRQNEPQILVNGVLTNLPYSSKSLNGSLVQAYNDGSYIIIETGFGLRVTYGLFYYVTVTIPESYRNKTCGLCGNFDGVSSNDFRLPDSNVTQDVNVFGRAWKVFVPGAVCEDGCEGSTCLDCDPRLKAIFEKPPYCGVLVDPNGPFAACHAVLNPTVYLNDCVFDTCASDGNNSVVCDSVARYAFSCRTAGVIIQKWRTDSFCPMSCPAHSHYEPCVDVCSAACPGLTTIVQCPRTCTEGCACDNEYLFDGQKCVEHQQCGCYQQGRTYKAGEVVYLDQCVQKCQCDPGKGFTCEKANCLNGTECLLTAGMWGCFYPDPCRYHRCPEGETCRSEHGNAVCVPLYNSTCWAWGDPHYHTFDGYEYNFQGTCRYVLSKTCGNLNGLEPYSVTQSNENRGSTDVSYVREVEVTVYGSTYTMVNHHTGQIMVDGLWFYLPLDHQNGRVRVRQSGNAALLETNFGLRVSYMWGWRVDVHLPSSYYGVVCGLCGNLNSNIGDELKDPAGNPLPSVYQWAKSWRVEDNYHVASACNDGCETDCPVCPPDLRVLYETDTFCGVLTSTGQNVFSACHTKVNPQAFKQSCAYDLCFNNGDHRLLCQALETYVARCRQEGVIITDWRGRLNCSMSCPPDSHYEACASPCPAVCPFPNQQPNCTDTCVEACVCNSGFVLSAGACVPTNQCGCFYKGAYYQQGQTFWADDQCHQLCTCDRNLSTVVCRNSSCPVRETCSVVNGSRSCQPLRNPAICTGSVDPHYRTFDGLHFDFQGTCVYQLAALCSDNTSLVPFNVTVKNDNRWSNTVSFTHTVNVSVNGFTITLTRDYPYQILFDGQLAELPFWLQDVFIVFRSGNIAVVKTNFGLQVTFDWSNVVTVTLPSNYSSAVCGLCGNYNGVVQDDFTMHNGIMAPSASSLDQSWQVAATPGCSSAGCLGAGCSTCTAIQRENAQRYCEIIANRTGPFRECHTQIDPRSYLEDCIFDTCLFQGHQVVLCDAVAAYASACQSQNVTVHPWRNATFCPLSCPPNSHYNPCAPGCTETCVNTIVHNCSRPCAEACQCDPGYILSGQTCVPQAECGCFYRGRYYKKRQMFYVHDQCLERCVCGDNGMVSCQASRCGPGEACRVEKGVLGCHPVSYGRCIATGDPHYWSFDDRLFDFQGACVYTLAKVCDRAEGRLIYFSVDTQNEPFGSGRVSIIKNLTVTVYNLTIGIRRGESGRVIVNNEFVTLPSSFGQQVTINQVGYNIEVKTDFGLRVLYDTFYHAEVHVPSNYQGRMCGLCGNYNGNKTDDFLLPNGTQSTSADAFGQAWALPATDVQCGGQSSPQQCDQIKTERYGRGDACGLMAAVPGPFSVCHGVVKPEQHVINCVFDLCVTDGDRAMLCKNLQAYASICQQAGIQIMPWRNASFCPMDCPANSHYAQCSNNCANTCASLSGSVNNCPGICMEGCQCDKGWLSNGDTCVPVGDCGCVYNGKYLKVGEVLVTDTCDTKCVCRAAGLLECVNQTCAREEICEIRDAKRDCYSKQGRCVFDASDKLWSFDGVMGTVGRLGAFQMAFLCDQQSRDWFRVVLDIHACARNVTMVHAFFQDMIITVNNRWHSWVNGKKVSYPFMRGEVSVSYTNEAVVIEKVSTMRLTYSVTGEVVLSVSTVLKNQVCGACGNFNGVTADDMTTSDGRNATMMSLVASSWQAEDFFACDV